MYYLVLFREQGRLNEAADLLQEVLDIREKLNGRDHQSVSIINLLQYMYKKIRTQLYIL